MFDSCYVVFTLIVRGTGVSPNVPNFWGGGVVHIAYTSQLIISQECLLGASLYKPRSQLSSLPPPDTCV